VWPGYGDNMRVLKWIIDRLEGKAAGQQTMFGVAPQYAEINWNGIEFSAEQFKQVTSIDKAAWAEEFKLHDEHFAKLSYHMPKALLDTRDQLEARLATA
jgi:phosphoenolpyruvate carboxykinase (GTP)